MHKAIKLMPDYQCFPLWDMDGKEGNINPDLLRLSDQTKARLNAWADCYDKTLNQDDPLSSGFPSKEEEIAFEEEGNRLWKKIQEELGPGYKVHYFSQLESRLLEG